MHSMTSSGVHLQLWRAAHGLEAGGLVPPRGVGVPRLHGAVRARPAAQLHQARARGVHARPHRRRGRDAGQGRLRDGLGGIYIIGIG